MANKPPEVPRPVPVLSQPGVKRDGTKLEGEAYVDAQWCRFQRGLPRKMLGYRRLSRELQRPSRGLHEQPKSATIYLHSGSSDRLERLTLDLAGNASPVTLRTPASGFTADANNLWQFDTFFPGGATTAPQLLAHVAPNLADISNGTGGKLFSADLTGTGTLADVTPALATGENISGGVVVLHPFVMLFGDDGFVIWSDTGSLDFTTGAAGSARPTAQKIVCGRAYRGGPGTSPSGLLWSLDSLIVVSFAGTAGAGPTFSFNTVTTESSILSSRSVIEYDGVFYWLGVDRFLVFNGAVREVPNNFNRDWFFDNINPAQYQKVFAMKVPRFGEIWWCFPFGDATECTHAVIYNVRENIWYDTVLPEGGRTGALFPKVFQRPLMVGSTPLPDAGGYELWQHETGFDRVRGSDAQPIASYFETADISLPVRAGTNKLAHLTLVEPDFVQSGPMTMEVRGRANARAADRIDGPFEFPETPSTLSEQVLYPKVQRREMRFRFTSNTLGGYYELGTVLAHIKPGDGTVLG